MARVQWGLSREGWGDRVGLEKGRGDGVLRGASGGFCSQCHSADGYIGQQRSTLARAHCNAQPPPASHASRVNIGYWLPNPDPWNQTAPHPKYRICNPGGHERPHPAIRSPVSPPASPAAPPRSPFWTIRTRMCILVYRPGPVGGVTCGSIWGRELGRKLPGHRISRSGIAR